MARRKSFAWWASRTLLRGGEEVEGINVVGRRGIKPGCLECMGEEEEVGSSCQLKSREAAKMNWIM